VKDEAKEKRILFVEKNGKTGPKERGD